MWIYKKYHNKWRSIISVLDLNQPKEFRAIEDIKKQRAFTLNRFSCRRHCRLKTIIKCRRQTSVRSTITTSINNFKQNARLVSFTERTNISFFEFFHVRPRSKRNIVAITEPYSTSLSDRYSKDKKGENFEILEKPKD